MTFTPISEEGGHLHDEAQGTTEDDHGSDPDRPVYPGVHVVMGNHHIPAGIVTIIIQTTTAILITYVPYAALISFTATNLNLQ